MLRACIEHPKLLHLVSAAGAFQFYTFLSQSNLFFKAGVSRRVASIFVNNGLIPVLACIMSPSLTGKQLDTVHVACNCLEKLASAPLPDECAAAAAAAILKCSLINTLAVHVAPLPHAESPRIVKSKSFVLTSAASTTSSASIAGAAAAAASNKADVLLQKESVVSAAVAAVWAVTRNWFIWCAISFSLHINFSLIELSFQATHSAQCDGRSVRLGRVFVSSCCRVIGCSHA
jgi:hypothetical protein